MKKQPKYFYLSIDQYDWTYGVAYAPKEILGHTIWEGAHFDHWTSVRFVLESGKISDLQANDCGWTLCSTKLRGIIDEHASPEDNYEWLAAIVVDLEGKEHDYHILHVPDRPDVLDEERSTYSKLGNSLIKPALSVRKVGSRMVVMVPGSGFIYFAEPLVKAIKAAGCTGMKFSKAPVA